MTYRPIRNSAQLCPGAVNFQSCPAPGDLAGFVQEFWQYDVLPGSTFVPIQVFPSGCVVLRFDIGPDGLGSVLYPPSTSPHMKSVFRFGVSAFGVALRVGRAHSLLGVGVDELGEARTKLENVWPGPLQTLQEQLWLAPGFPGRVAALACALRAVLREPSGEPARFSRRLEGVISSAGNRIDRTTRREFQRYVGHSPKQLQRVIRVQYAMRRLALGVAPLGEVALASGFCDQPHLTREFKRLVGMTPGTFRSSLGRFHRTDLPIWAGAPVLQKLGLVPRNESPPTGVA